VIALRDVPDGCTLPVRVHPGAKRNQITGEHDGAVKISLTTPPTDGRANEALIAFLAAQFKVPRASITLLTGAASRSKTLRIAGKSAAQIQAALSLSERYFFVTVAVFAIVIASPLSGFTVTSVIVTFA
jgi:uncharacterized protein (TIGR00251 family)